MRRHAAQSQRLIQRRVGLGGAQQFAGTEPFSDEDLQCLPVWTDLGTGKLGVGKQLMSSWTRQPNSVVMTMRGWPDSKEAGNLRIPSGRAVPFCRMASRIPESWKKKKAAPNGRPEGWRRRRTSILFSRNRLYHYQTSRLLTLRVALCLCNEWRPLCDQLLAALGDEIIQRTVQERVDCLIIGGLFDLPGRRIFH